MANLSDAYGKITAEKCGKEFLEFLHSVQGEGTQAYYKLAEVDDFKGVIVNSENTVSFGFSTFGRWQYLNNLEGFLEGKWLQDENDKKAYLKFAGALVAKNGRVIVDYSDSDEAMGWKGEGVAVLEVVEGTLRFTDEFVEKE